MMLRIGEFARRGRVSVKALRHYEAIGLLKPAHVDAVTGYRSYAADQLDDLHRLMVLRALGLSLERIRHLEGDRDATRAAVVRDVPAAFVASLRRVVEGLQRRRFSLRRDRPQPARHCPHRWPRGGLASLCAAQAPDRL
jgi:DNA-binding transcriptional MerR regulator